MTQRGAGTAGQKRGSQRRAVTSTPPATEIGAADDRSEEGEGEFPLRVFAPFVVHYQPIVDLQTLSIIGGEALARWPRPNGQFHGPGSFIEGVESDASLAEDLTAQLLSRVREDVGDYLASDPAVYVSVNIPAVLLGGGRLASILEAAGLNGIIHHLVLEITERHAPDAHGRIALRAARAMGARVALDDFGTGNSGFYELMEMEIDILKIDRSLVEPLNRHLPAERLVRGLAMFAAILGVKLVAEGVENREQAAFLRAAGVHAGQGWLWAKALPPADFIAACRSGAATPL